MSPVAEADGAISEAVDTASVTPAASLVGGPLPGLEASMLAVEMAKAYRRMVEHYRRSYQRSPPEAAALTDELSSATPTCIDRILTTPDEEITWFDLHRLAEKDPALAAQRWKEVRQAATDEVQAKVRAAQALEGRSGDAWQRAQFFALCRELEQGWQPRNGVERQLLDTMAQAQTAFLYWLTVMTQYTSLPVGTAAKEEGTWVPPRVSEAEAIDKAAAMVDRFNRIFLRTLRALRDLRRYTPHTVVVQNAGQVNVGRQQVNMAEPCSRTKTRH